MKDLAGLKGWCPWIKAGSGLLLSFFIVERLATVNADPDLWGFLAFGRLFWHGSGFPYRDVFSFLPTLDLWVYHEWLTGVLFYPVYQAFGAAGLQFLKYLFGLAALGLVYLTSRERGGLPLASVLFIILIMRGFIYYGYSPVRAQIFTYFFFALTLYLLETSRQDQTWRRLWVLIPIQVLWCNLHGGFLAGLGLVALYAVGEALSRRPFRPYLGILVLAGLATLINPYGMQYWYYLVKAISMPRPQIGEWGSVFRLYRTGLISSTEMVNLAAMIMLLLFLAWRQKWRELTPILCLGLILYVGLANIRHLVFFYLLVGAYLPVLLTPYFEEIKSLGASAGIWERLSRLPGLILALIALFTGLFAYHFWHQAPFSLRIPDRPLAARDAPGNFYPVGAVEHIRSHGLAGKLLTEFGWGEYLIWHLHPRCLVGLDGRYETVYPEEVAKEYFAFIGGETGWKTFLKRYPPDMILIDSRSRLYRLLRGDHNWRQAYADAGCALFLPAMNTTPDCQGTPSL